MREKDRIIGQRRSRLQGLILQPFLCSLFKDGSRVLEERFAVHLFQLGHRLLRLLGLGMIEAACEAPKDNSFTAKVWAFHKCI